MSQQQPPGSAHGPDGVPVPGQGPAPAWAPPTGWSPEQPPTWPGTPQPPAGPPPGHGQAPPPGYGQAPPPAQPGGQQWPTQQPYAPQYGQPVYGQPTYGQSGYLAGIGHPGPWAPPPQAPKPGIVPLRPLGIGELLDGALGLIRSNPRTVLGLAAAISAISAVIQTVGMWIGLSALGLTSLDVSTGSTSTEADVSALVGSTAAQLVPALIASFLTVLASGLFIVLVGAAVLGRRLDGSQAWTQLKPRLGALIALTLLLFLGAVVVMAVLVGGVIAMVSMLGSWAALPGVLLAIAGLVAMVYLYVRLAVASPALVIEGLGPVAALGRSWQLVRGSWWRVAGILLLSSIITQLLATVVSVPITMLSMLATGFTESLLPTILAAGLATLVAGIVTLPFGAAVTGLLYTDLRMRREALDIELISAGVDPGGDPLAPYRRRH